MDTLLLRNLKILMVTGPVLADLVDGVVQYVSQTEMVPVSLIPGDIRNSDTRLH